MSRANPQHQSNMFVGHVEEGTRDNASDPDEVGEEYEGEEQLATVTVVEDFDPTSLHEPLQNSRGHKPEFASSPSAPREKGKEKSQLHNTVVKTKPAKNRKPKYQTKAARAADRAKQRARHKEKAERAGGKASRSRKR